MFKDKFVITIVIVTFLILVGGFMVFSKTASTSSNPNGSTAVSKDNQKLLEVASDDWIKGNKDASVTLVEYMDFECEACGAYYPLINQLEEEFKNEVRFVNRYFPLPGHKNGLLSALAVEAAGKQGKYWEMHDILFENQKTWGEKQSPDPTIFEGYAKQIKLNIDKFKKDVVSQEIKDRVNRDKNAGVKLGVSGTPTFFLNGEKIPNPKSLEDFRSFIQAAVIKAAKPSDTTSQDTTTIAVKEFTMTAKKFDFSPATITVSEGDKVKITIDNLDVPHGFAIKELDVKQDLPVGKSIIKFTASKKGTFRFFCSLFCGKGHKEMEGKLIVE